MGIDDGTYDWNNFSNAGYGTDPSSGMNPDWWNEGYGQDPKLWNPEDGSDMQSYWGTGIEPSTDGSSGTSGGSLIQKLLQGVGGVGKNGNAADLSSLLGAFSSGQKANRVTQGNFTQGYDKLMLEAQDSRNKTESDALKKMAQTAYITGGGSHFTPPSLSLNGKDYTSKDLGYGPPPISDAEKAGASALQGQLQARLSPGGTYTPQPLNSYATPGLSENIGSYGAVGVGALGAIGNMMDPSVTGGGNSMVGGGGGAGGGGGQTGTSGVGSSGGSNLTQGIGTAGAIGSLAGKFGSTAPGATGASAALGAVGKFAGPIAGAAIGTYGVVKNPSVGSDTLSGMGAGASIGSLAGPVGTVVGAGVGALVGALRGAWSVTGKEQNGRDVQQQVTNNLKALSSPQQRAEAAKSGWPDPNQALSLIVMRDKLTQSGASPQAAESQAEQYMHSLWDAEKHGAEEVVKAGNPIQSMMGTQFR